MLAHTAGHHGLPVVYVNQVGGKRRFDLRRLQRRVRSQRQPRRARAPFCNGFSQRSRSIVTKTICCPQALRPCPRTPTRKFGRVWYWACEDYARKCGFSRAILGLSGGIDSSLVAAIAATALGPENVLGVLMPSPYSSDHSIKDAEQLAENLGIATQQLPIGELMRGYDRLLEPVFSDRPPDVTEENLQSRIRGNLLMAVSNKLGYLLLSTGNKSEMAVGYCTLYGDMNGGLAVISDVPKTRVFSLCAWLNRKHREAIDSLSDLPRSPAPELIPTHVLSKPPSAELRPGQVDTDSLPPYEVLDEILERAIVRHESPDAIVTEGGFDPEIVDRVFKLANRAEFKRRQAPPGLKITDRAFGTGWRMPIAAAKLRRYPS